jgi:hypothetical protein
MTVTERPVHRTPADPTGRALAHSGTARAVLSVLFVLHWGAVATLVVLDTSSQRLLPPPLRPAFERVLAPAASVGWPVARVWLDATSSRQHWMLFAPAPSDWTTSLVAVASYGGAPPDTVVVPGPAEDPLPHWGRPRAYDLAFNLAYEGSGVFYRTLEARRLCRGIAREGASPDGVLLGVLWRPLDAPWAAAARAPIYREVGSYRCAALLAAPPSSRNP